MKNRKTSYIFLPATGWNMLDSSENLQNLLRFLNLFFNRILDLSEERRETFARHKIEKISPAGETEVLTPESLKLQNYGGALFIHIF